MEPNSKGNLSSTYLLAKTNLNDEQKLQLALCRRQCWVRAWQFGVAAFVLSCPLTAALSKTFKLPRAAPFTVPVACTIVAMTYGSYYGGKEGAPMAVAAIREGWS